MGDCQDANSEFRSLDNTALRVRDHHIGKERAIENHLLKFMALFSVGCVSPCIMDDLSVTSVGLDLQERNKKNFMSIINMGL